MDNFSGFLIAVLLSFATLIAGQSSFKGGHIQWKASGDSVFFDYNIFYDMTGNEARRCTDDAIRNRKLIPATTRIYLWLENPETARVNPVEIGRADYYCVMNEPLMMRRVVGEFKGFSYKARLQKFYVGFFGSSRSRLVYTYVDLTKREGTNIINRSPIINMFPYYQVYDGRTSKITIQTFDEDNDYIECHEIGRIQSVLLDDCVLTLEDSLPVGVYTKRIGIQDLRNKDQTAFFSRSVVTFDVEKLNRKPPAVMPVLTGRTMQYPFMCWNEEQPSDKKEFKITYDDDFMSLRKVDMLGGSNNLGYSLDKVGKGEYKVEISWNDTKDQSNYGKRILCFSATVSEKVSRIVHTTESKCWYLSIGKDNQHMAVELIKPKENVLPKDSSYFEFKVHGAFNGHSSGGSNFLAIHRSKDRKLQYYVALRNAYRITPDNRIILNTSIPVTGGEEYFLNVVGKLFEAQGRCAIVPTINGNDPADYYFKFNALDETNTGNQEEPPKTEFALKFNNLHATIPTWYKTWRVSFLIKPTGQAKPMLSSIIHLTTDGNCCDNGDRIPAVWFNPRSFRLRVATALSDEGNHNFDTVRHLRQGVYTKVTIEQVETLNREYIYRIFIDGYEIYQKLNTRPMEYKNVKLYTGDPFYSVANAYIKDLEYRSPLPRVRLSSNILVINKNKKVANIHHWPKSWRVSLKIKPQGQRFGTITNIIHFTTGGDCCVNGQRIPALWFQPRSFRLRVASSANGDGNVYYDHDSELPNRFVNVVIEQIQQNAGNFILRFFIDDALVWSRVNDNAQEFYDVDIYASNPFLKTANAMVRDFKYEQLNADRAVTDLSNPARDAKNKQFFVELKCNPDSFEVKLQTGAGFNRSVPIKSITLFNKDCQLGFNPITDSYFISSPYTECFTSITEESEDIVFKNVAIVNKDSFQEPEDSIIVRTSSYNIGLECRLPRSSVHTVEGKAEENVLSGLETMKIHSFERGTGEFSIDFEVYKTKSFLDSYGMDEFPIRVGEDARIYMEISLNKQDLNLVPQNCYATVLNDHTSEPRYYLIDERCPSDRTYIQHRYTNNVFQFSVETFTFKTSNSLYIHCESYICKNATDPKCRFGCDKDKPMRRMGRSIDNEFEGKKKQERETFITSTLEIKIKDDKPKAVKQESGTDVTKIILFAQIPIAILLLIIGFFLWRCLCQKRIATASKTKIFYKEAENTKLTEGVEL